MTDEQWAREMGHALGYWRSRGLRDPDLIADALAWYWILRTVRKIPHTELTMRWVWSRAWNRIPLPGTGRTNSQPDALDYATGTMHANLHSRRYLDPAYAAEINERVHLVKRAARREGERVAIRQELLSQTILEAASESGIGASTICASKNRLRRRCRALRL